MERDKLEAHVKAAVNMLFTRDAELISQEAAEWSITSRLAHYLEAELPGWHVDCEYNRQGEAENPKRTGGGKIVRPDIAVHHRGRGEVEHNLLAVELKRNEDSADDQLKACEYTAPKTGQRTFQYQHAVVIDLAGTPPLKWFENGAHVG